MPNLTGGQALGGSNGFIRGTPWLNWWIIEQDRANNRTRIGVEFMLNAGTNRWNGFHERGAYWINGAQHNYDNGTPSRSGNFYIFRHEHHWVQHDANGNLHISITADCWIGDAKFVVENVNGSVPRLGKAPDINSLRAGNVSSTGMTLFGELHNYGRGTSTNLQTQLIKSGDGWGAGGWREWQGDAVGENRWAINGLAPNTSYSFRMIARNNNGDQSETGEHKQTTLAVSNILRHKVKSPTSIEITLNTPKSLNKLADPTTKVEYFDGKSWETGAEIVKSGEYTLEVKNLKPNKEYRLRVKVRNAAGTWTSQELVAKTLPACVIIEKDGTVLNCVPYMIKKTGEIVDLDIRVISTD